MYEGYNLAEQEEPISSKTKPLLHLMAQTDAMNIHKIH